MRGYYYIVSGILFILPIIDFAVAAPAPVREKRRTDVNVVNIPEHTINMLGKRGDQFNELWLKFLKSEGHLANPVESAPRPSLPSGILRQPLPEEPVVSGPGHTPPSQGSLVVPNPAHAPPTAPSPELPSADRGLTAVHAPSNAGPSTVSDKDMGVPPSQGPDPNH